MSSGKARILFFSEAVTLAHVARPLYLAQQLDGGEYDIHVACDARYARYLTDQAFTRWPLKSIPQEQFREALAKGSPIYDYETLSGYLAEDLRLIERVRPDLVVGDFRLSLPVSAALIGVPCANIVNAHWSPYAAIGRYPVPDLPFVRVLGEKAASVVFNLVRPFIFRLHAGPMNRLRRQNGLGPLDDLLQVYTAGDHVIYPDVPQLVPTIDPADNHRYIGPVLWEPPQALPEWWNRVPEEQPCLYVTLGSSGASDVLETLLNVLARMPLSVLVATAGAEINMENERIYASEYLPGIQASRRSSLVICNGGSGTLYQALAQGTPVLGIPSNLDQHLTMAFVAAAGAGLAVRSEKASEGHLREAISQLLGNAHYGKAAMRIARTFDAYRCGERFASLVAGLT